MSVAPYPHQSALLTEAEYARWESGRWLARHPVTDAAMRLRLARLDDAATDGDGPVVEAGRAIYSEEENEA